MHLTTALVSTAACAAIASAQRGRYDRRSALDDLQLDEPSIHTRSAPPYSDAIEAQLYARDLSRRLVQARRALQKRELLYLQELARRKDKDAEDDACDDCDADDSDKDSKSKSKSKSAQKPLSEQDKNKQKDEENKKKDQQNKKQADDKRKGDEKTGEKKKSDKKKKSDEKKKAEKKQDDKVGENDDELLKPDPEKDVWDPEDSGKGKKDKNGDKKKSKAKDSSKKAAKEKSKAKKVQAAKAKDTKPAAAGSSKEPTVTFFDSAGKVISDLGGGATFKSFTNNALHIDRQAAKDGPAVKDGAVTVSTANLKDSKAVLKMWDNDKAEGKPVAEIKGKDLSKEKMPKGIKSFTLTRG